MTTSKTTSLGFDTKVGIVTTSKTTSLDLGTLDIEILGIKTLDIKPFLCLDKPTTLEKAIYDYHDALMKTGKAHNIKFANKLLEYLATPAKSDFDLYIRHMQKWKMRYGYTFTIECTRRKKSFIKFVEKILLFLSKSNASTSPEKRAKYSLDKICDIYGIRIILCMGSKDTLESVEMCYEALNETIRFFTNNGYTVNYAEPLVDLGFSQAQHPDVVVPKKAQILEGFEENVKDYYLNPKANGYQSLHIIFKDPEGKETEIQIRTQATHMRVEFDPCASHASHDTSRYPERLNLSPEKINIQGFAYYAPGLFHDGVGLFKSIDPFRHF